MGMRGHNALLRQRDRLCDLRGADGSTRDGEGWRLVNDPVDEGVVHGVLPWAIARRLWNGPSGELDAVFETQSQG